MYEVKYHIEEKSEGLLKIIINIDFDDISDEAAERIRGDDKSQLSRYLHEKEKLHFINGVYRDKFRSKELKIEERESGYSFNIEIKTYERINELELDKIINLPSLYEFVFTGKNKESNKVQKV